jgi:hypothetical protein
MGRWPDERHRFRQIADIVVGIAEKNGIDALDHERPQHGRFDGGNVQVACDGR